MKHTHRADVLQLDRPSLSARLFLNSKPPSPRFLSPRAGCENCRVSPLRCRCRSTGVRVDAIERAYVRPVVRARERGTPGYPVCGERRSSSAAGDEGELAARKRGSSLGCGLYTLNTVQMIPLTASVIAFLLNESGRSSTDELSWDHEALRLQQLIPENTST